MAFMESFGYMEMCWRNIGSAVLGVRPGGVSWSLVRVLLEGALLEPLGGCESRVD